MACPVQTISRDIVRPSSPTPDHLRTHKLSLLDQVASSQYIPLIFFYHHNPSAATASDHQAQACQRLRQSLSQALALFYPLAGKIGPDNLTVDCNDRGAEFVEARVAVRLGDVLRDPELDQLQKLVPVGAPGERTLFMVQVNFFDCGGIVVSACVAHNVADFSSFVNFMNAWAAISRGDGAPEFGRRFGAVAPLFPAWERHNSVPSVEFLGTDDRLVTKRLVFDKEKISSLINAARSDLVSNPSRVVSVTAFIWQQFIQRKRNQAATSPTQTLAAAHVVNLRPRADPSLHLRQAFGNACFLALAVAPDGAPRLGELAARLRIAIQKIDAEYIKAADYPFLREVEEMAKMVSEGRGEGFMFSSWCGFPVYEVDFGWGRPDWVCTTPAPLKNLGILMDGKTGKEIEAWISSLPEDVEALDKQFRQISATSDLN